MTNLKLSFRVSDNTSCINIELLIDRKYYFIVEIFFWDQMILQFKVSFCQALIVNTRYKCILIKYSLMSKLMSFLHLEYFILYLFLLEVIYMSCD